MHRNLSEFSVNFIRLKLYWHMCCKNRVQTTPRTSGKKCLNVGTAQFYLTITYFFDFFSQLLFSLNKEDYKINQIELAEFETSFTYGARMMSITNEIFPSSVLVLYVPLYTMVESFFLSLCPRNSHLFKSDDNEEVNGERSCPILSFCPSINARKTGRSMLSGTSCKKGQFDGRYQTIFGFKLPTNPYSSLFRRALYASRDLLFLKQKIF